MADYLNGNGAALRQLAAPARNHYFYGKLLDVMHFQMEQAYFNRKRWLMNRLGLGSGVLCGLEVVLADNGQSVWLRPGVAIDPLGREIIVPVSYCLENPRQPTDDQGRPAGDPIPGEGVVALCLAYHECATEPVPVLVGDCDTRQDCAPSTIRERFRLLVRASEPGQRPGQITDEQCQAIFPGGEVAEEFDHRLAACETLTAPCLEPDETCVMLATIALPANPDDPLVIDACTYRTNVYSNSLLWELMTCLADRVDRCCQARILRYVSGDAQQAKPGAELPEPLVVEVLDGNGQPVADETVTFRVRGGGGSVAPDSIQSDANGQAETRWTLGPAVGLNTMEAAIASGSHVSFLAMAVEENGTPTTCIDFEDLPEGNIYRVGDTFVDSGVTITARTFFWSNETPTDDGFAEIETGGLAGGTGREIRVNNINLAFDFGAPLPGLSLRFGEYGGNLNIEINGDFRNFTNFADINGLIIGNVSVTVVNGQGNDMGTLTLAGTINSFVIGGQELWLDDICLTGTPATVPPMVTGMWPPNAGNILSNEEWPQLWLEQPRLAVVFDREMREDQVDDPQLVAGWLRAWQVQDLGEIIVRRLQLELLEITDEFLGLEGFIAIYALRLDGQDVPARYIVQMRAENGNITDTGTPPLLLDAEFAGTELIPRLLETIWQIEDEQVLGSRDIWEAIVDTGATLPQSGDGAEGGQFHAWFEFMLEQ